MELLTPNFICCKCIHYFITVQPKKKSCRPYELTLKKVTFARWIVNPISCICTNYKYHLIKHVPKTHRKKYQSSTSAQTFSFMSNFFNNLCNLTMSRLMLMSRVRTCSLKEQNWGWWCLQDESKALVLQMQNKGTSITKTIQHIQSMFGLQTNTL